MTNDSTPSSSQLIPLIANQAFPSYKALCEYLGEEVKSGDSKIAQLKVWESLFSWEKRGHSFIITQNTSVERAPYLRPELYKVSTLKRPYSRSAEDLKNAAPVLTEGLFFPSYKELSLFLKEPPATTKEEKERQLERWSMFFSWEASGGSSKKGIIIKEVFHPWEPLDEVWKYSKFVAAGKLLLSYFIERAGEVPKRVQNDESINAGSILELTLVSRDLYKVLGFHGEAISLLTSDSAWEIKEGLVDFHRTVREAVSQAGREVFRQELLAVLNHLEKKKLLKVFRTYYVTDKKEVSSVRLASMEETMIIATCKDTALKAMRLHYKDDSLNEYSLHVSGKAKEFYGLWLKYVQDWYEIESLYPALTLQAGAYMQEDIKAYLLELEVKGDLRKEQNQRIVPKVERRSETALTRLRGVPGTEEDLEWMKEIIAVAIRV